MKLLGKYDLDFFQFALPSHLKLSLYLKEFCSGSKNFKRNCAPLISSENVSGSIGLTELPHDHILDPENFGRTLKELKWKLKEGKYSIPSQHVELQVFLDGSRLKFCIIPHKNQIEQYHIEFSSVKSPSVGDNLAILYLKYIDFMDILSKVDSGVTAAARCLVEYHEEPKAKGKESFRYASIPVNKYNFNTSQYKYISEFIKQRKINVPAAVLYYDPKLKQHKSLKQPVLHFGRNIKSELTGDMLCRIQLFLILAQEGFNKAGALRAEKPEDMPEAGFPEENSFEVEVGCFLDAVHTYICKFGPLYLWKRGPA